MAHQGVRIFNLTHEVSRTQKDFGHAVRGQTQKNPALQFRRRTPSLSRRPKLSPRKRPLALSPRRRAGRLSTKNRRRYQRDMFGNPGLFFFFVHELGGRGDARRLCFNVCRAGCSCLTFGCVSPAAGECGRSLMRSLAGISSFYLPRFPQRQGQRAD